MSLPTSKLTLLRRAFVDICRGYSIGQHKGVSLYVKHLSHRQHMDFEDIQLGFHEEAVKKGALAEVDRLKYLVDKGLWTTDREDGISRQRDTVIRFEEGRKQLIVPSLMKQHEAQIESERKKLSDMLIQRAQTMGITAEVYAQQRLNDYYILHNLFLDKELTRPVLTEGDFEDMTDTEVQEIVSAYNKATDPSSDTNLRLLAVQDFFMSYYSLCNDSLADFFGRPVAEMTYYMIRLGNSARYFRSLIEHMDMSKVPPSERNDPDAIERLSTSQKNSASMAAEGKVANVGLTKDDIEKLGLQGQMAKVPKTNMSFDQLIDHARKTQGATRQ